MFKSKVSLGSHSGSTFVGNLVFMLFKEMVVREVLGVIKVKEICRKTMLIKIMILVVSCNIMNSIPNNNINNNSKTSVKDRGLSVRKLLKTAVL